MNFVADFIPTLGVLGALILVHEFGHFIACRLTGVRVEKFSIGFGPEILHFQGKETRYAVSLLPFGGYVKPSGESVSEIGEAGLRPYDYLAASVPKRIFIVSAGVGMNYLLSFVLFVTILLMGRPVALSKIGGFVEGYPAEKSGLERGDLITSVAGVPVETWEELTRELSKITGEEVELQAKRGVKSERIRTPVRVEPVQDIFGKTHRLPRIGILPDTSAQRIEKLPFPLALDEAFQTEVHLTLATYKAIFYLVTGRLSLKTVSGPLGIMAMTGSAVKMGWVYLLHLAAVLGISLAVINLPPIPALDGGHFVFLLIEAMRGRRLSLEFQERATQVGFALLMALMVFVLYNDLVNLDVLGRLKAALSR